MKNSLRFRMVHMLLIGVVLLLAACTKEEPVAPCGQTQTATGETRSLTRDGGVDGATLPTGTITRGGGAEGGPGISDDGDDEADKERKRKGKR